MMDMNVPSITSNAGVARKIPGPLSKTRVNGGDSTNRNILPSPAMPATGTGIEGTLAPSSTCSLPVSSIESSVSTVTMSQPQNAVPGRPINMNPSQIKTTCLLCDDQVDVSCEDPQSKAAQQRYRIIKVLFFHLQMEEKDVPKICTPEMFPFCHDCDGLVKQIYENEQVIQAAQNQISKRVSKIERTVADAEMLLNNQESANVSSAEGRKFGKLRQAILDGYKAKLVMKRKLKDIQSLVVSERRMTEPSCSHISIYQSNSINRKYYRASSSGSLPPQTVPLTNGPRAIAETASAGSTSTVPLTGPRASGRDTAETASVRPTTMNMSTGAMGASNNGRPQQSPPENDGLLNEFGQRRIPNQVISLQGSSHSQSPPENDGLLNEFGQRRIPDQVISLQGSSHPQSPAQPSVLPMGRSAIRTGSGVGVDSHNPDPTVGSQQPPNTGPNAINVVDLTVVKEEPADEPQFIPMPAIDGKRRKRQLFQRIEIFKVSHPSTNQVYLQCSICNQAILKKKAKTNGMTSLQTMNLHITEKHLGKKRKRICSSSRKRGFTCKVCAKVFENKKLLFDHKKTHPGQGSLAVKNSTKKPRSHSTKKYISQELPCDICGKAVKGNLSNLNAHKFSHQNNEERQAAIAAGETGFPNRMMRSSLGLSSRPRESTSSAAPKLASKKPMGKYNIRKRTGVSGVVTGNENKEGTLQCNLCLRKFEKACNLARHAKSHSDPAACPKKGSKTSKQETGQQEQEEATQDSEDQLHQDQESNNGLDGSSADATTANSQNETMLESSMEHENDASN